MADLECPYCGAEHEICHDDGFGYSEGAHQDECGQCGKRFLFFTSISFSYEAKEADCLNGGEHQYRPSFTVPLDRTRMLCRVCEDSRCPTEVEMVRIVAYHASLVDNPK